MKIEKIVPTRGMRPPLRFILFSRDKSRPAHSMYSQNRKAVGQPTIQMQNKTKISIILPNPIDFTIEPKNIKTFPKELVHKHEHYIDGKDQTNHWYQ